MREHGAQGNEREVDNGEVGLLGECLEVTDVGLFEGGDLGMGFQGRVELVGADVDGVDMLGVALEEEVGEAASGGTDVSNDFVCGVDVEGRERGLELVGAAADVLFVGGELELGGGVESLAGFADAGDLSLLDQEFGLGAGSGQALLYQ